MDAVSLETPQENEFVKQRLVRGWYLTEKKENPSDTNRFNYKYELSFLHL